MSIIARPDVLEEDYTPPSLPYRETQKKELVFCLMPLQKGLKPVDCLCHGKPGTGKTVLVKYVLNQLEENTNALAFYVNCWENKTLTQILDQLLRQAQLPIVDSKISVKLTGLRQKIKRKPKGLEREMFSVDFTGLKGGREYVIVAEAKDVVGQSRVEKVKTPYIREFENFGKLLYEKGIIMATIEKT